MIKYPSGVSKTYKEKSVRPTITRKSAANRGMTFEDSINKSNEYYREKGIALILKRTTPINVVKVDYTRGAKITEAYFEKQSTTDYNGVYKGKYIDFEAKSTHHKTSFPLANIYKHQIEHLQEVIKQGGIAFFLIDFEVQNKIFLVDASFIIDAYYNGDRKSIKYETVLNEGIEIEPTFLPPIDYIKAIDKKYF